MPKKKREGAIPKPKVGRGGNKPGRLNNTGAPPPARRCLASPACAGWGEVVSRCVTWDGVSREEEEAGE